MTLIQDMAGLKGIEGSTVATVVKGGL